MYVFLLYVGVFLCVEHVCACACVRACMRWRYNYSVV